MISYPVILQILALVSGLVAFKATRPDFRILVTLLAITVLNELVLIPYLSKVNPGYINFAYNIFSLIDMTIWYLLFSRIFTGKKTKRIKLFIAFTIIISSIIEIAAVSQGREFHTETMRIYNLSVVLLCIHYFYILLNERFHRFITNPIFLLTAGAFIYHTILFLNFTTLSDHGYWKFQYAVEVYYLLQNIANTCYYLLIISAFGCWIYLSRKDLQRSRHS